MGYLNSKIKTMQTPDGIRDVLEMPNSVCFGIVTADNYLVMAQQYRAVAEGINLSIYGGYIDNGETTEQALKREMFEESNIRAESIEKIEYVYRDKIPSMGICTERNTVAVVYLNKTKKQLQEIIKSNDLDENIKPLFIHLDELDDYVNELDGLKAFLCVQYLITNKDTEIELQDGFFEIKNQKDDKTYIVIKKAENGVYDEYPKSTEYIELVENDLLEQLLQQKYILQYVKIKTLLDILKDGKFNKKAILEDIYNMPF